MLDSLLSAAVLGIDEVILELFYETCTSDCPRLSTLDGIPLQKQAQVGTSRWLSSTVQGYFIVGKVELIVTEVAQRNDAVSNLEVTLRLVSVLIKQSHKFTYCRRTRKRQHVSDVVVLSRTYTMLPLIISSKATACRLPLLAP